MALNIQSLDTITYRTDCFQSYSNTDHYIRDHDVISYSTVEYNDGYTPNQTDVPGTFPNQSTGIFDIGYNPQSTKAANPIICDKLLLFSSLKNAHTQSSEYRYDTCYSSLLFNSPMLLIDGVTTYYQSTFGIQYKIPTESENYPYMWVDEIKAELSGTSYVVKASGTYYRYGNSKAITNEKIDDLTEWSAQRVGGDFSDKVGKVDVCIEFLNSQANSKPNYDQLGRNGLNDFICTKDELTSRFTSLSGTGARSAVRTSFPYGCLMLPYDSFIVQTYTNTYCAKYRPALSEVRSSFYNEYHNKSMYLLLIPFLSENEYNAAKASIYKWNVS